MIHSSDATSYSAIRSHAGFVPPRSALVRTDTGIRLEARPKYNFLNPFRLPERNSLIVGVQPGFGIRDDNFDIHGNPVPPAPPGTTYYNIGVTLYKYCDGGAGQGVPVCVTVNPNVFTSNISQIIADLKASNAADAVLFGLSAGPCCNVGSKTTIQDATWTLGAQQQPVFTGPIDASIAGTPANVGSGFARQSPTGDGSTVGTSITWATTLCNPWPEYDVELSMDWAVSGLASGTPIPNPDSHGSIIQAAIFLNWGSALQHSRQLVITAGNGNNQPANSYNEISPGVFVYDFGLTGVTSGSGSFSATIPIDETGQFSFLISAVAQRYFGLLGPGIPFITISNLIIRPVLPPVVLPLSCSIISHDDSPLNDYFDACQIINGAFGSVNGTNAAATMEVSEPAVIDDDPINYSVWYCWTAPANGPVTFHVTPTSGGFPAIAAYTGISVDALTLVAGNSPFGTVDGFFPGAQITFTAVAGTIYYIQVASEAGSQGTFTLNWS